MKSYAFTRIDNLQNMNTLKRKEKISKNLSRDSAMSSKTKDFIQKICYKKTASIDMTQYGFINDSKMHPANLLLKPLRAELEKICGKPVRNATVRKNALAEKKVTLRKSPTRSPNQRASPLNRSSPPSALSSPGSHSPRRTVHKVIIPSPTNGNKRKVRVILPTKDQMK